MQMVACTAFDKTQVSYRVCIKGTHAAFPAPASASGLGSSCTVQDISITMQQSAGRIILRVSRFGMTHVHASQTTFAKHEHHPMIPIPQQICAPKDAEIHLGLWLTVLSDGPAGPHKQ